MTCGDGDGYRNTAKDFIEVRRPVRVKHEEAQPQGCLERTGLQKWNKVKSIVGFILTTMGTSLAVLNLVAMFPKQGYEASWGNFVFAAALAVFGGVLTTSTPK